MHWPGKNHGNADGLSRIPYEECTQYEVAMDVSSLPCGGCTYCTRMHEQWERFDSFMDDVIPLTIRQVQSMSRMYQPISDLNLEEEQPKDPDLATVLRCLRD